MQCICKNADKINVDEIYSKLCLLESLVVITKESCINKELSLIYYDLNSSQKFTLSKERNHYINLLEVIEDKLIELINEVEVL